MNNRVNFYRLLIIIFLLISTLIFLFYSNIKNEKITPEFEGFFLTEKYSENNLIDFFRYEKNQTIIKFRIIKNIEEKDANNLINSELISINTLYSNSISHYPDVVSNQRVCDESYIPIKQEIRYENIKIIYFILYLTERETYGACVEDILFYKGINAWAYCEEKKEYRQFEIFTLKENFNEAQSLLFLNNICK